MKRKTKEQETSRDFRKRSKERIKDKGEENGKIKEQETSDIFPRIIYDEKKNKRNAQVWKEKKWKKRKIRSAKRERKTNKEVDKELGEIPKAADLLV